MIIILNGPLGVGKTETAWKLLEQFEQGALLDLDYVGGNVSSFDFLNKSSLEHAFQSMAALGLHQSKELGITDFIVSAVLENEEQLEMLRSSLEVVDNSFYTYFLTAEPVILEKRIRKRMRENIDWEVSRATELLSTLENAGNVGVRVETTNLSIAEVAAFILESIRHNPTQKPV